MDVADLEGSVELVYGLAGLEGDGVRRPTQIARCLFGRGAVIRIDLMRTHGSLATVHGTPVIAIRRGMGGAREEHAVGHELGHWILERERSGLGGDELEAACDYIGAALMTRRRPFARRARELDVDIRQLALDFRTTETMVALRVGEVMGESLVVISPQAVRVRGPGEWPDEGAVRELARRRRPDGVKKVVLSDDCRRCALFALQTA